MSTSIGTQDRGAAPIPDRGMRFATVARRVPPVLPILIVMIVVSVILAPGFSTIQGLNATLNAIVPVGIVAVGMTFVIVAGGIDISVGATFAAGGVAAVTIANATGSPILAAVGAIALGAAIGVVNGVVISALRLNAFIVTLGTAAIIAGGIKIATDNSAVYSSSPEMSALARSALAGLSTPFWILVACLFVAFLVLSGTVYGRSVFAVGDSLNAARLMGLATMRIQVSTYLIAGAAAALGGFVFAAQTGVGLVTVSSNTALLSIAAVVVGGTALVGGRGGILRTAIGVGIFAVIDSLFRSLALTGAVQNVVLAIVILVALTVDRFSDRSS